MRRILNAAKHKVECAEELQAVHLRHVTVTCGLTSRFGQAVKSAAQGAGVCSLVSAKVTARCLQALINSLS